ncbi:MAG: hypothetical protein WCF65_03015 [Parachlamydiaceae bacterium]
MRRGKGQQGRTGCKGQQGRDGQQGRKGESVFVAKVPLLYFLKLDVVVPNVLVGACVSVPIDSRVP